MSSPPFSLAHPAVPRPFASNHHTRLQRLRLIFLPPYPSSPPPPPPPSHAIVRRPNPTPVHIPTPALIPCVCQAIHASQQLQLESGILVGVPIPLEAEAEAAQVQAAIERALVEVENGGIGGREVTPYVLKRVNELTGGASLAANIALIKNNAAVGARVAAELSALRHGGASSRELGSTSPEAEGREAIETVREPPLQQTPPPAQPEPAQLKQVMDGADLHGAPVVVGGAVADLIAKPEHGRQMLPRTSNPGTLCVSAGGTPLHLNFSSPHPLLPFSRQCPTAQPPPPPRPPAHPTMRLHHRPPATLSAGVGRNIAESLTRLGCPPLLLSAVADDAFGDSLIAQAAALLPHPLPTSALRRVVGGRTPTFTALEDGAGDLLAAVADMDLIGSVTPDYLLEHAAAIASAPLCIADANIPPASLQCLAHLCATHRTPLWLEPVSLPKAAAACAALAHGGLLGALEFMSPNEAELLAMAAAMHGTVPAPADMPSDAEVQRAAAAIVLAGCKHVFVTRGARGILWAYADGGRVSFEELPAAPATVCSTLGAGDAFVAGTAWGLLNRPRESFRDPASVRSAVLHGMRAARITLESASAVSPQLSAKQLLAAS